MPFDSTAFLANPVRETLLTMAAVLTPPPPVDHLRWAEEHVRFGAESPLKGPYDRSKFPFFDRIFKVLGPDHPARVVVLCKSAQLGGTVLAQIFIASQLDTAPGPILYTHPTEGNAKRWVRTKWRPMIRATKALLKIIPLTSTKEGTASTLYQERFDGRGYLQISGANSAASLSMVSMDKQVQDDLAKWETNEAGDPEIQADSRSKAYEWAKIFKVGTPLLRDNCRITRRFLLGTQEYWEMPCPHCGARHAFEWENFRHDADDVTTAHFVCPSCSREIHERHRQAMVLAGEWTARNPKSRIISFHLWAAYSPLTSWARLASEWEAAKGDPAAEQTFFNDTLGRAYDGGGDSPPWEALRDRAELGVDGKGAGVRRRGIIPRGALLLVLSMDCQDDRVEWLLVGFGCDLKRYVVDAGVVDGHIETPEARADLDKLVETEWRDFQGNRRKADLVGIDANYSTTEVYDWARRWPQSRVLMLRGVGDDSAPPLAIVRKERTKDGKIRRWQKRFFNVGVSGLKLGLYKLLALADPLVRGFVDIPAGLGDEFFQQLTSERRQETTTRAGFRVFRWVKPKGERNEILDLMNYAEALAIRLGWRTLTDEQWALLEAEREAPPAERQLDFEDALTRAPVPPASPAPIAAPVRSGGDPAVQSAPARVDPPAPSGEMYI